MTVADQIKKLVQLGKLEDGLKMLNDWAAANDEQLHNTTILLLSRFNQLKRSSTMGIISSSEAERTRNQLSYAVLSTLEDLPVATTSIPAYSGDVAGNQQMSAAPSKPANKKLFISYAREDRPWVDKLERHMVPLQRRGLISSWTDSKILPGQKWDERILTELKSADIILFMVSADFLSSEYIYRKEVPEAMRRYEAGLAAIVPVILRPSNWHSEPYARFQAMPRNAMPITKWADEDEALVDVINGIAKLLG